MFNIYFFNDFVGVCILRYFKESEFFNIANSVAGIPNGTLQIPQVKEMIFAFFTFSFKHVLHPTSMLV